MLVLQGGERRTKRKCQLSGKNVNLYGLGGGEWKPKMDGDSRWKWKWECAPYRRRKKKISVPLCDATYTVVITQHKTFFATANFQDPVNRLV